MIGNKEFFMGLEFSEVDCVLFGMLVMILWNMFDFKYEKYVKGGCLGCFIGFEYFFYSFVYIFLIIVFLCIF